MCRYCLAVRNTYDASQGNLVLVERRPTVLRADLGNNSRRSGASEVGRANGGLPVRPVLRGSSRAYPRADGPQREEVVGQKRRPLGSDREHHLKVKSLCLPSTIRLYGTFLGYISMLRFSSVFRPLCVRERRSPFVFCSRFLDDFFHRAVYKRRKRCRRWSDRFSTALGLYEEMRVNGQVAVAKMFAAVLVYLYLEDFCGPPVKA